MAWGGASTGASDGGGQQGQASQNGVGPSARGRLIVRYEPGTGTAAARRAADAIDGKLGPTLELPRTRLVKGIEGDLEAAAGELRQRAVVEWAQADVWMSPTVIPNDPHWHSQFEMRWTGVSDFWERTTGDSGNVIGTIDTGMNEELADFAGRMVPGWSDESGLPSDLEHGTAVAGIAAATGNNATGIAGLDWETGLMQLRCGGYAGPLFGEGCWSSDIGDAMVHAGEAGLVATNISLGGNSSGTDDYYGEIARLYPGTLYVAAAGNDGRNLDAEPGHFTPCEASETSPNVLCVGALEDPDHIASYSNVGANVNVAAPGTATTLSRHGGVSRISGTSIAAPYVTGAAALLAAEFPDATAAELRSALESGKPTDNAIRAPIGSGTTLDLPAGAAWLEGLDDPTANVHEPRITGLARVGYRLRAWPGIWSGRIESTSYTWQRDKGFGYVDIAGADSRNYTPQQEDGHARLRVRVTVGGPSGEASSHSAGTSSVDPQPPAELSLDDVAYSSLLPPALDPNAPEPAPEDGPPGEFVRLSGPAGDVNGDGNADLYVTTCEQDRYGECPVPRLRLVLGPLDAGNNDLGKLDQRGRTVTLRLSLQRKHPQPDEFAVEAAGDVDGDGFDDLAVGESRTAGSWVVYGSGRYGSSSQLSEINLARTDHPQLKYLPGSFSSGHEVGAAGDVNGDGFDDVLVGNRDESSTPEVGADGWGAIYVVLGGEDRTELPLEPGIAPGDGFRLAGYRSYFPHISRVTALGDENGDGFDDFAIAFSAGPDRDECKSGARQGLSEAWIYHGSAAPLSMSIDEIDDVGGRLVRPLMASARAPEIAAADVNGDGRQDLIAGSKLRIGAHCRLPRLGTVTAFASDQSFVDTMGLQPEEGFWLEYGQQKEGIAEAVAGGDLNGDGFAEVLVGSDRDSGLGRPGVGTVSIAAGANSKQSALLGSLAPPDGRRLIGNWPGANTGSGVSAGDLDGDSRSELVVATAGDTRQGRVDLVAWSREGLTPQQPPRAFIEGPGRVSPGTRADFDASESLDPEGPITSFRWDLDGDGQFETPGAEASTPPLEAGRLLVGVEVHDSEGAIDRAYHDVTVAWADEPDTRLIDPPTLTNASRPAIHFDSDDPQALFECRVDDDAWEACTSPHRPVLEHGFRSIEVRAVNAAGHADSSPARHEIEVDLRPPETTITYGPEAENEAGNFFVGFTASEPTTRFECRAETDRPPPGWRDGWYSCVTPAAVDAAHDGSYAFEVRAVDVAGNTDSTPARWESSVQTDRARLAPEDAPDAIELSSRVVARWFSYDRESVISCRLDGRAWEFCASPHVMQDLSEGKHELEIAALGASGYTHRISMSWKVDTEPPDTYFRHTPHKRVEAEPGKAWQRVRFHFGSSEEASRYQCRKDGRSWMPCYPPTKPRKYGPGRHSFKVRAFDQVGRRDPTPARWRFRVIPQKRSGR